MVPTNRDSSGISRCNTRQCMMQRTATCCTTLPHTRDSCDMSHVATYCNTLYNTYCNTCCNTFLLPIGIFLKWFGIFFVRTMCTGRPRLLLVKRQGWEFTLGGANFTSSIRCLQLCSNSFERNIYERTSVEFFFNEQHKGKKFLCITLPFTGVFHHQVVESETLCDFSSPFDSHAVLCSSVVSSNSCFPLVSV